MGKSHLALVASNTVFGAVRPVPDRPRPPRKRRNADVRPREYLTETEVDHAHRDATMIQ